MEIRHIPIGEVVAGLDIGNYNGTWDKLFRKSIEVFKRFSQFLLITDGDTSIWIV